MKLIALDTATEVCTVALWLDGEVLERFEPGARHSERILPMVDALLAEAGLALTQIDALAFGRGPGSFTGLRIGAGIAQGLAFGADLPVVPVSSLAALAQGVDAAQVLAAIDARMQQVYWAMFRRQADGLVQASGDERVAAPAAVPLPIEDGWVGAGSGWDRYEPALAARLGGRLRQWHPGRFPLARDVARLGCSLLARGQAVPAELALPVYVRDDVAKKSGTV
jgi:tRNA threonylcarbamoyladenosine biosynthesis protein TsaB